jgi:hypothetical protein
LVVAFLLQFLPLLAIPFAFRFASGALRRIYDAATTAGAKANQLANNRREQAKMDYRASHNAARARMYHSARDFGQQHQGPLGIGRRASRWAARRAGGYNIEGIMSAGRAEAAKQLNDQINTGRDEEIRGLTVNKDWALNSGREGVDWRMHDGVRQFKSLGGAWIDEQDVDAGHARWGRNQYAQQAALSYEMRKAITEEDSNRIVDNYMNVAGAGRGGWGMSAGEAGGSFKGAAFENQNQHLEYKYSNVATGRLDDDKNFVDEIYERRGSYNLAQMNSRTIEQLKVARQMAIDRGDVDQQQKITAIAETFMHDLGVGGGGQIGAAGEEPVFEPVTPEPGAVVDVQGGAVRPRQASTQGAAHVAERVRELAVLTGAYRQQPTGLYGPGHAPTDNRREQK